MLNINVNKIALFNISEQPEDDKIWMEHYFIYFDGLCLNFLRDIDAEN